MTGFKLVHRDTGAAPNIRNIISHDAAMNVGDLVMLSSQKVTHATTNSTAIVGVVLGPEDGTKGVGGVLTLVADTDKVRVVMDADAVYAVTDANARKTGDILDIAGLTGAMTVATNTNHDLVVYADSSASEPTLVRINRKAHFLGA